MYVLIVISFMTMTGPWSMRADGGMNGFYVPRLSERACNEAKKRIVEQAQKLGLEGKLIVLCQKED